MTTLTQQEREKFVLWLNQEAESNKALIVQMEKMGSSVTKPVIKVKKTEVAACLVVAQILGSAESVTL